MNTHTPDRMQKGKPWWDDDHSSHDGVVADRNDFVSGQTVARWTGNWWQWATQAPAGAGPLDNGADQSLVKGHMVFIAGVMDAAAPIHAPAHTPILFPMINAFDTEGPGIETLSGFVASGRGSYADEARYVTDLAQKSIYDAHATLTMDTGHGRTTTIFDVHLQGSEAARSGVKSGTFALGVPAPGSWLASVLPANLDPSIANLPNTSSSGDWIELNGLKPGTYTLAFGGAGHAAVDPVSHTTVFNEGWGFSVKDTLVIR